MRNPPGVRDQVESIAGGHAGASSIRATGSSIRAHLMAEGGGPDQETVPQGGGADGRGGRGCAGVLRVSRTAPGEAAFDQHPGAAEQGSETASQRGRHLPKREQHHAPDRGGAHGAKRRLAATVSLLAAAFDGGDPDVSAEATSLPAAA